MELRDVNENRVQPIDDNNNNYKKKTSHKELFEEFYSGVTLHGFRFLFQGHWSRKLVWFVITSAVFLFSIYLFSDLYLEHQTTTESRTHFETEMKFPTITFCPLSTLSKKKLDNLPTDSIRNWFTNEDPTRNLTKTKDNETLKFLENLETTRVDNLIDFYSVYHVGYEDLTETDILKKSFSIDRACTFYDRTCNISMFTKKEWRGRLCFQFNALQNGQKQAFVKGTLDYFSGLQLYFDFGDVKETSDLNGMLVMVTRYGDSDDMKPVNKYIDVRPGEYTIIKLKEKQVSL